MSEVEIQNLLDSMTNALLGGQDDHAAHLSRKDANLTGFMSLILMLQTALKPQQPSDRFMRQLKRDLVGEPSGVLSKLNMLPARVRIATGLAAGIAGIMWISRRNVRSNEDDGADLSVLQPGS